MAGIIWYERDEAGNVAMPAPPKRSEEDRFRDKWRAWGMSEEHIDRKWAEFLQIEGFRFSLEQQRVAKDEIERRVAEYQSQVIRDRTWGR